MNTLPLFDGNDNMLESSVCKFFGKFSIGKHFKKANGYKTRGIPAMAVLMKLVALVFTHKSLNRNYSDGTNDPGFKRDVAYRLLNSTAINWTAFVLGVALQIIMSAIEQLTSAERLNIIAVDDSLFERPRSKKVELLAKVYDHAGNDKGRYKTGFRMLTAAWTDGSTMIPLMFRHMSSQKQKNRYMDMKPNIDKRSIAYKIRRQAVSPATEVLLEMLAVLRKAVVPAKHVVFDSWFSYPATIMAIKNIGFDVVGRLKNKARTKFAVNGKDMTLSQIYASNRKRRGRSKYLLSVTADIHDQEGSTLSTRIVFVRDRNNAKKWVAFICTDSSLTEDEIITLYGKRWDIEVFFKVCKSYLKLTGEFQQISYDSTTAHTAIVFLRYMLLAYEKRVSEDWRTCGDIFYLLCDEVSDVQFDDILRNILAALRETMLTALSLTKTQIFECIEHFLSILAPFFKHDTPQFGTICG